MLSEAVSVEVGIDISPPACHAPSRRQQANYESQQNQSDHDTVLNRGRTTFLEAEFADTGNDFHDRHALARMVRREFRS